MWAAYVPNLAMKRCPGYINAYAYVMSIMLRLSKLWECGAQVRVVKAWAGEGKLHHATWSPHSCVESCDGTTGPAIG